MLRLRFTSSAAVFACVLRNINDKINWDINLNSYYYHKSQALKSIFGKNEEGNEPVSRTELSPILPNKNETKP